MDSHVFANSIILIDGCRDPVQCPTCDLIQRHDDIISHNQEICDRSCANVRFQGPASYEVLLTCWAFYREARSILASNLSICIGIRGATSFDHFWRSHFQHAFLDYAIPYITKIRSSLYFRSHARLLGHFFYRVRCIEFGPDIACFSPRDRLLHSRQEIESRKYKMGVVKWMNRDIARWQEESDLEDWACLNSAKERISFHINIGAKIFNNEFYVSKP